MIPVNISIPSASNMLSDSESGRKKGGGRPAKFAEPSRPVTVTLPESTLRELQNIDPDRGHAIVKLTKNALGTKENGQPLVEIVEMASKTGLVVVGPSKFIRQIPFLHLVEIAPARFLLALEPGHDFTGLEIALNDLLEVVPDDESRDQDLIRQLLGHIKQLRKAERVSLAQVLFVRLPLDGQD